MAAPRAPRNIERLRCIITTLVLVTGFGICGASPTPAPTTNGTNGAARIDDDESDVLEVVIIVLVSVASCGCLICLGGCFCSQFADKYCDRWSRRLEARIMGQEQEPRPAGGNVLMVAEAPVQEAVPMAGAVEVNVKQAEPTGSVGSVTSHYTNPAASVGGISLHSASGAGSNAGSGSGGSSGCGPTSAGSVDTHPASPSRVT